MADFDSSTCPDRQLLLELLAGRMDLPQAQQITRHLESCKTCRLELDRLRPKGGYGAAKSYAPPALGATVANPSIQSTKQDGVVDAELEGMDLDGVELGFLEAAGSDGLVGRLGPYDIQSVLGRGGMGIVFKGFDASLNRLVAIKVMTPQLSASERARRRFLREARAAAAVNHPNVVTIHAVGEHNGLPYLVMEYIHGCSLRERLRRDPPLDLAAVLRISAQAAQGLTAAHAQGLIHRDIKPANIMLEDQTERVKITDFGLARAAMDLTDITSLGHPVGTPSYMSPEQMNGGLIDARSDLFSFGCVMYAMFTGHSPFHAGNNLEVMRKVAEYNPPRLHEKNPDVPRVVADLVSRLMEKHAGDRIQSSAELAEILTRHVATLNQTQSGKVPLFDRGLSGGWLDSRLLRKTRRLGAVVALVLAIGLTALFASNYFPLSTGTLGASGPPSGESEYQPALRVCSGEVTHILSAAVSPVGTQVLFGGEPETDVIVWDWGPNQRVRKLSGHESWVYGVAIDRDGRRALTAGGGSWKEIDGNRPGGNDFSIRLWDIESGRELKCMAGHTGQVRCVGFLADGRHAVSGGIDHRLRVWSLESGQEVKSIESQWREILSLAVSTVDSQVAVGAFRQAGILNIETGQLMQSIDTATQPVLSIAYSPDGQLLALGLRDGSVRLWSVAEARMLRRAAKHDSAVRSVAFSADGRHLLSGGDDRMIRWSDVETGRELRRLQTAGAVYVVAFCPDGDTVFSAGPDARIWSLSEFDPAP